jgi:hypothetical protein
VAKKSPQIRVPQRIEFAFRGNAVAASGYLTRRMGEPEPPLDPDRPTTHGESSLPVIGGISRNVIQEPQLRWPENIRYGPCRTEVQGVEVEGAKVTTVVSSVQNALITTRPSPPEEAPGIRQISFAANALTLAVRSSHRYKEEPEFEVLLDKVKTDGLFLIETPFEGEPIRREITLEFHKQRLICRKFSELKEGGHLYPRSRRASADYRVTSIVRDVFLDGKSQGGYILRREGFGVIFFGEMLVNRDNRRITLVRIRMGSDPAGVVAMSATDPNGIWRNE